MEKLIQAEQISEKRNLEKMRSTVEDFFAHSEMQGFITMNNESLDVGDDNSLLFANSSIAKYKKEVSEKKLPESGYCISQKCLRAWSLLDFLDREKDFEFNSYFTMIGVLFPGLNHREILASTIEFLSRQGFDANNIFIKTSVRSTSVNSCIPENRNFNLVLDSEETSFYKWVYGTDTLKGEGITISYKRNSDSEIRDLGNIIAILDESNNIIAWESGFGLETMIATRDGVDLFRAHPIWDVLEYEENLDLRKFADSIVSITAIILEGVTPGPKAKGYILKKFLTALYQINKQLRYNISLVVNSYCDLMNYENSTEISNKISDYLTQIEESKKRNLISFQKFIRKNKKLSTEEKIKIAKESFSLEAYEIRDTV